MPKILLIPEFGSFGGTRRVFFNLLEFYKLNNYNVLTAIPKEQYDNEAQTIIKQYGYKVRIIRTRYNNRLRILEFFPFNVFRDFITILPIYFQEKPDMIVVSNGTPGQYISTIVFPIPLLYIFNTYPMKGKVFFVDILQRLFVKMTSNPSIKFLTVSEYSKKQIIQYWTNKKNVFVIPSPTNIKQASKVPRSNKSIQILTMGHVTWYKNPFLWIDVAKSIIQNRKDIDIRFVWAGDGDLLEECRELTHDTANIRFIGYQKDVNRLYEESDIYFQPSILESQGLSVIDAMAVGLPCVVSNAGGLPESVINLNSGYVCDVSDKPDYIESLLVLIDNPETRRVLGEHGMKRINQYYTKEKYFNALLSLHTNSVISGNCTTN